VRGKGGAPKIYHRKTEGLLEKNRQEEKGDFRKEGKTRGDVRGRTREGKLPSEGGRDIIVYVGGETTSRG